MATRRTRSLLIDATLGKIFTNTNQVFPSDPSKLIAGTKQVTTTISALKTVSVVTAKNLGLTGAGKKFTTGGLITGVTLSAAVGPLGSPITVALRVGLTYETSELLTTISIPDGSNNNSQTLSHMLTENHAVFLDVLQKGLRRPGQGLSIGIKYYAG